MSEPDERSVFVTVVAWLFIAISGLGAAVAVLQNLLFWTMFSGSDGSASAVELPPEAPPFMEFVLGNVQWILPSILLLFLLMLVCSIGLLKRRNWARLFFVGLMGLGIAWQVLGVVHNFLNFSSMEAQFEAAAGPGGAGMDMGPILIVSVVMGVLFALAFAAVFGWIAAKLLSAPIAREFRPQLVSDAPPGA